MVSPNNHVIDPRKLSNSEIFELFESVCKAKRVIDEVYHPVGMNIGFNIGDIPNAPSHLKIHIVPRYNPESGFMEIIGNSRVVVETLEETYEKMYKKFD